MCVVSMIGDDWRNNFPKRFPELEPFINPNTPSPIPRPLIDSVSREEFNKLRAEMEELRSLLKAAKKYDEATNQPDCEVDEKVALIMKIAELVGVDMQELTKKKGI